MKRKVVKTKKKQHGRYFCSGFLKWISFWGIVTLIVLGNLIYRSTQPNVLGISTTIYHNCSFWDIFCPIKNIFFAQDAPKAKAHVRVISPTPTLLPTPSDALQ